MYEAEFCFILCARRDMWEVFMLLRENELNAAFNFQAQLLPLAGGLSLR